MAGHALVAVRPSFRTVGALTTSLRGPLHPEVPADLAFDDGSRTLPRIWRHCLTTLPRNRRRPGIPILQHNQPDALPRGTARPGQALPRKHQGLGLTLRGSVDVHGAVSLSGPLRDMWRGGFSGIGRSVNMPRQSRVREPVIRFRRWESEILLRAEFEVVRGSMTRDGIATGE